MKTVKIEGTNFTPFVVLDANPQNPKFEISGRSVSEDVKEIYDLVLHWFGNYFKKPLAETVLVVNLEYFNTQSSKLLLDILLLLDDMKEKGHDVKIKWHFPENGPGDGGFDDFLDFDDDFFVLV